MDDLEKLLATDLSTFEKLPNVIVSKEDTTLEPKVIVKETVTYLNGQHLLMGEYPTLATLKEDLPLVKDLTEEGLKELFLEVNKILEEKRGLPPFQIKFKTVRTLDPNFVAACNLIFDVHDKRSVAAKLKDVKLTTKKFNALLRLRVHREFYEKLTDNLLNEDMWNESRIALARNVQQGDLNSIKYMHALTNKYNERQEFDPRILTVFMQAMLEIVTRHVDGNTARIIADEIDTVAMKELPR